MGIYMKVMCKIVLTAMLSIATLSSSFQSAAADVLGGGGNPAEVLLMDWANAKLGSRTNTLKFSNSTASNDLTMLQNGKIDFAIFDAPISDAQLTKMNLLEFPIALNGVSIVANLQNSQSVALRLDSQTLGKIFSGEISSWDDPAIAALNPKHELPNKPIIFIHSGELSTDYALINKYIGSINEKWKASDKKREWPANSVYTENFSARIATIKSTPYALSYLPMQFMRQSKLSVVHLKNKDGNFTGLSDTSIIASTATINYDDGFSGNYLINKTGSTTWPLSTYTSIVIKSDRIKDEKIIQLLSVVSFGLRLGSIKATAYNYVALPDPISKSIQTKIETLTTSASTIGKVVPAKITPDNSQEEAAKKKRLDDESNRQRAESNLSAQEEKNRLAKQHAEEQARELAIKEAKAGKLAAEEATKAAQAAKVEADKLAEKNRLIAAAEKERADKERAEKERIEKERIEKERAIQLRNQKDEDPLEAYRRSVR
jgi:phosphate transport system substrate-binding protein